MRTEHTVIYALLGYHVQIAISISTCFLNVVCKSLLVLKGRHAKCSSVRDLVGIENVYPMYSYHSYNPQMSPRHKSRLTCCTESKRNLVSTTREHLHLVIRNYISESGHFSIFKPVLYGKVPVLKQTCGCQCNVCLLSL